MRSSTAIPRTSDCSSRRCSLRAGVLERGILQGLARAQERACTPGEAEAVPRNIVWDSAVSGGHHRRSSMAGTPKVPASQLSRPLSGMSAAFAAFGIAAHTGLIAFGTFEALRRQGRCLLSGGSDQRRDVAATSARPQTSWLTLSGLFRIRPADRAAPAQDRLNLAIRPGCPVRGRSHWLMRKFGPILLSKATKDQPSND